MKLKKNISLAFLLSINAIFVFSQNCPSLGPDQNLPCGITQTVLTANLTTCNPSTITANQTNTYSVTNIPFAPYQTILKQVPFRLDLLFAFLVIRILNFILDLMVGLLLHQASQTRLLLQVYQVEQEMFQKIVSWDHGKIGIQELEAGHILDIKLKERHLAEG
jgi:hypothetical protein